MEFIETLIQRNAEFALNGFNAGLKILPSQRTMILGCVDPRVDPMDVLGLQPGEAAIIRNVGGRVDPAFFETMDILRTVSKAGGEEVGRGWSLVLLQHTKCGIKGCYHHAPALLAQQMRVEEPDLAQLEINDPYKAVAIDVAALRDHPSIPGDFTVSGLVYDVDTGLVDTVVAPARLRPA
ncbi:carbonic anhydrase [Rhodoferax sp.]|uniref:carbonic anhydrase n=1 Tax=Rhodoferax sp. TaxID=50421 RepID=UPI00374DCA1F